jgi:hypothetical protein
MVRSGASPRLTPTWLRWLAWSLAGLTFLFMAGTVFLVWLGRSSPWRAAGDYALAPQVITALSNLLAPLIGALIAARWPRNSYGWIWLAAGIATTITQLLAAYALHGLLIAPGSLPLAELALRLTTPVWFLNLALSAFVILLFPRGRLPSPHWRMAAWVVVGALASGLAVGWSLPGLSGFLPDIESLEGTQAIAGTEVEVVALISMMLIFIAIITGVVSLLFRFRRATGVEHQQLKWFTYGGVLVGAGLLSELFQPLPGVWEGLKEAIIFNILPPLTIGVAILRHRLYDIDLLIRRTLVYSVLTICLALVYFGSVIGLQSLVPTFNRPARHPLVTVISTLAIAALFTPLRRRIQESIDRRFYRRKYDAEQILAAFRTMLRSEVNLDSLTGELLRVVKETMQPAHASVWLRKMAVAARRDREQPST